MTLLLLKHALLQTKKSELEFFQEAFLWKFKKIYNCVNDVVQFRLHAIIPRYVAEYLDHIYG